MWSGLPRRFATAPRVAAALRRLLGPPVASASKDLGVDQQLGRRDAGDGAAQRAADALLRLQRCRAVALPLGARCRLVAASGVPAALYGCGVTALPPASLRRLRRAALGAMVKAAGRVSLEASSALLVPRWRADLGA